jgi:hypothetical protein
VQPPSTQVVIVIIILEYNDRTSNSSEQTKSGPFCSFRLLLPPRARGVSTLGSVGLTSPHGSMQTVGDDGGSSWILPRAAGIQSNCHQRPDHGYPSSPRVCLSEHVDEMTPFVQEGPTDSRTAKYTIENYMLYIHHHEARERRAGHGGFQADAMKLVVHHVPSFCIEWSRCRIQHLMETIMYG